MSRCSTLVFVLIGANFLALSASRLVVTNSVGEYGNNTVVLEFEKTDELQDYSEEYNFQLRDVDPNVIEDAFLKTNELIEKYGYKSEVHYITTADGYILETHRIPKPGGQPVLLVHGLLDCSATWVIMGPGKGFAYILAGLGYDVWMANVRGNSYSKNHTVLDPKKARFWQFTFHDIGRYDIPAVIDYVLEETGFEKLHYIGHSQGTAVFWVMCSERPEYNDKVLGMQAMAPIAFVKHCKSPVVNFLAFFRQPMNLLFKLINANEFLPNSDFLALFSQILCRDETLTQAICTNIIFLITGYDKDQMNMTMLPAVLGHIPAGSATRNLMHFAQLKSSGHFRQFDYGMIKNYAKYGRFSPPDYNLKNVFVKVALHYASNDYLSDAKDLEMLYRKLPNAVGKFLVKNEKFNHLDFVWGIDAKELLYNRVVKIMKAFESGEL